MKKTMILLAAALMIFAAGCAGVGEGSSVPSDSADIRGTVSAITVTGDTAVMLVEGKTEDDTLYDKASVRMDEKTQVMKDGQPAGISDIRQGDQVEAVFEGVVAESYPVQAYAKTVRILGD